MKKTTIYIVALALVAIVVIRLKGNKETTENRVYQYNTEVAINVQAITLKPESVNNDISYPGTFEPNNVARPATPSDAARRRSRQRSPRWPYR